MRPMPGMIGLVSSNSKVHNVQKIQSLGHVGDVLLIDSLSIIFCLHEISGQCGSFALIIRTAKYLGFKSFMI